jgi:hypothetical protein
MNDEQTKDAFKAYQGYPNVIEKLPDEPAEGPGDDEFHISLTATATNQDQASRLFAKFSGMALDVAHDSVSQMVSSHKLSDDGGDFLEGEFYNERTLLKVLETISANCLDHAQAESIVNDLLNAGVLFRERR